MFSDTGKDPIGARWVDINKGDKVHPELRSRLVAQEIKMNRREDLFAATPPLEAKKLLFSFAVTEGIGYVRGNRLGGMKLISLILDEHISMRWQGGRYL